MDLLRGFGDKLVQDVVNICLVSLEFVSVSGHAGGVVPHCLLAGHEVAKAHVGSNGDSAVDNFLAALFAAHQFQVTSKLFNSLGPLG